MWTMRALLAATQMCAVVQDAMVQGAGGMEVAAGDGGAAMSLEQYEAAEAEAAAAAAAAAAPVLDDDGFETVGRRR